VLMAATHREHEAVQEAMPVNIGRHLGRRLLGAAVAYQFDPLQQATAANVADDLVALLQRAYIVLPALSDLQRPLGQVVLDDLVDTGCARLAGEWIVAVRVAAGESVGSGAFRDLVGGDGGTDGDAA